MERERYYGFKTKPEGLKTTGNCCGCGWYIYKDSMVNYDDYNKFICQKCFKSLKLFVENGLI